MLETFKAVNEAATFNRWAGIEATQAGNGEAELRMNWRAEDMGQFAGFLHAGMISALLDTVSGYAAGTLAGRVMTSHFSVNFMSPAVGSAFVARGRVAKAGRKQVFVASELYAQPEGKGEDALKLVATGNAILVPVDELQLKPRA
ncbi:MULTISPECIES: PaaI family thioesterase [Variovorax]|uniref:PaaI family thioesterase n=1 Tax=Variovorax TaxID=34072 RepID=UPI0021ACB8E6|nr:PaaI family thioesterase [Variovorax paradoxus]UVH55418.1 PaaI family thioesterase [Variovorax paradoxus]